jgi:hypothetical protein
MNGRRDDASADHKPLTPGESILQVLMEYAVAFAGRYIVCARRLCQDMLKRYAEIVRIEAPVPRYRGFHVRPSTLVAKIVMHYGSDVQMSMDGESFDAASPMDIFRTNEKINARKRRWLAEEICQLPLLNGDGVKPDIKTVVRRVVAMLAERNKLVLYELPIRLPDELPSTSGTLLENVIDEMARLQATGKLDIDTDLNVTFVGDKRVLADIELLARHGYGEDNFGNNIPLPDELAYLRR